MSRRSVVAIILIFVGLLALARNLDLITWDVWDAVGTLWPVALVLFGVSLVLEGGGVRARGWWWAIIILVMAVAVGFALWSGWTPGGRTWMPSRAATRSFEVPSGAYTPEAVRLRVSLGSCRVLIEDAETPGFLSTRATYHGASGEPRLSESLDGSTLVLDYRTKRGPVFDVGFTGPRDTHELELGAYDLPTDVEVEIGSGEGEVRLGRRRVRDVKLELGSGVLSYEATAPATEPCRMLRFEIGSGRIELGRLGDLRPRSVEGTVGSGVVRIGLDGAWEPGETRMRLEVGSGEVSVSVPKSIRLEVRGHIASGGVSVDARRFREHGDFEFSEGPEDAEVRLKLTCDVSSGNIRIRTAPGEGPEA